MKLTTKTVATLLVAASIAAAVPGMSQLPTTKARRQSQFDLLLRRHDRKGELRAEILGMDIHTFRRARRSQSLDGLIMKAGMTKRAFRIALVGMLRDELLRRGWSRTRIDRYVMLRALRMA
jgi:hypothetical protein